MKNNKAITATLAVFCLAAAQHTTSTVEVGSVKYLGVQNETSGINAYYGIRYAKPPMHNLRWRPPILQDPRVVPGGFVNATTPGPACIQGFPPWQPPVNSSLVESEDCLRLDILTPKSLEGKLPVLVNIHGGGYTQGNAMPGDSLVYHSKGSLIYVAVQYRLGPLGFLAGDDVARDGSCNVGLLDQRAALEWVRQYIQYFGGDPEQVTILGLSAGGGSVAMQMILFGGQKNPPFRAAIAEYPYVPPVYSKSWFNEQYHGLLSASGCTDLNCLRHLSIDDLRSATDLATAVAYNHSQFPYGAFYWAPAVDGRTIRDYPLKEFRNGRFSKIPVLVDHDAYEGFYFTNPDTNSEQEIAATLTTLWQTANRSFVERVMQLYPVEQFNASLLDDLKALPVLTGPGSENPTVSDSFGRLQAIVAHTTIDCSTYAIAAAVASAGLSAYKMVFNAGNQLHGATIPFLYSSYINPTGADTVPMAFPNATLATYMRDYFVSFALHEDPNKYAFGQQTPPHWPRFTESGSEVIRVEFEGTDVSVDPEKSPQCALVIEAASGQDRSFDEV
ncbi:hypothetical protein VTO42DRAFT_6133 [Malbranchea cinnamomea]